jgi:hypothetical protein
MNTEVTPSQHSEEAPAIGHFNGDYGESVYYTVEVNDTELAPRIVETLAAIEKLEEQKQQLLKQVVSRTPAHKSWSRSVKSVNKYSGSVEVLLRRTVSIDAPQKPPATPKEISKLEKLTRFIDAKTLFNSGILTKEEKRELLGLSQQGGNHAEAA